MADCKHCRYYWQGKHDDEPRCYFREWDMRLEYPCTESSGEEKYIEEIVEEANPEYDSMYPYEEE